MRSQTRAGALASTALAAVLALTGCSTSAAPPNPSSPVASPVSTSTTKAAVADGPATVPLPSSAAEAISDANRSLIGYYTASFTSGHAGGTRLDLVSPWTAGAALRNEQILAGYLEEKQYRLEGASTKWTLNASKSSATQIKRANGAAIPYGAVKLVGCAESTNHPVGSGAPAWTSEGQRFKKIWSVLYDADRHQWIVAAAVPIPGDGDSATCD